MQFINDTALFNQIISLFNFSWFYLFNCFRWRDNPMLPRGLLYEGVSTEPIFLSGGSAAQSSAIQCFDALLCIQHEGEAGKNMYFYILIFFPSEIVLNGGLLVKLMVPEICFSEKREYIYSFNVSSAVFIDSPCTGAFLTRMRDYMLPPHRQLIETLSVCSSLRDFITACSSSDLCQAYNSCVSALVDLRNYHLNTVAKYVIVPGNKARSLGCPFRGVGTMLNSTGTGGSNLMVFLKSVRNSTEKALITERPTTSREAEM